MPLSTTEEKELNGLRALDTYDDALFDPSHADFKEAHNRVFTTLAEGLTKEEDLCDPELRPALTKLRVKLADDYDALVAALRASGERVPPALLHRRSRCDDAAAAGS